MYWSIIWLCYFTKIPTTHGKHLFWISPCLFFLQYLSEIPFLLWKNSSIEGKFTIHPFCLSFTGCFVVVLTWSLDFVMMNSMVLELGNQIHMWKIDLYLLFGDFTKTVVFALCQEQDIGLIVLFIHLISLLNGEKQNYFCQNKKLKFCLYSFLVSTKIKDT